MKANRCCVLALVCVAVLLAIPARAGEEVVLTLNLEEESADSCLDYTPVEGTEIEPALLLGVEQESVAPKPKPCREACPNQPWCECTYQGAPRISCDPCCYQTYRGVICSS